MKATTIYGGVQVFNILFSVIRSKVIVLIIGPKGLGIISLLQTTLNLVNGITSFGLDKSSVKDIAYANETANSLNVSETISVLKKMVWFTALFGAFLMIITSSLLSELAFKNKDYTLAIIWISLALIFRQLTSANFAILQGFRKLKYIAKANLISNFIGLIISIPLYYFFKIEAIVPTIILTSFLSYIVAIYFSKKTPTQTIRVTFKEAFVQGKSMTQLGFSMSISTMLGLLGMYLLQIYISSTGGVNQIGLYMAGYVILNTYVGLIFNAMSTDYYPKLAAINNNNKKMQYAMYQQSYMSLLILLPIVIAFLSLTPFIVRILYSVEFLSIIPLLKWGILGMILKAVSFSIGYIIIAKGDSKVFVKTAIMFNVLLLGLNVLGYYLGGLEGLGISFLIYYMIHLVVVSTIVFLRYKISLYKSFYHLFLLAITLCVLTFLVTYLAPGILQVCLFLILTLLGFYISYYKLNQKINIRAFVFSIFKRNND
ncbi:oligosaccharide flippase family protein [Aurantibacter sp.]|uniref:oligosaccharide flippase family protein n=1 Tax=Aurantibacter sp. TaxID=2807103 RepID=UPI0035C7A964